MPSPLSRVLSGLALAILLVAGASAQILTVGVSPQSPSVRAGASLRITATAPAGATLQWSRGAVDLPGETGATLTVDNLRAADQGAVFTVRALRASDGATGAASLDPLVITTNAETAFVVQTTSSGGPGSLREAVNLANASTADPATMRTATFDPGLAGQSIELVGEIATGGGSNLRIDASAVTGGVTVSGGNVGRIFSLAATDVVELRGLRLSNGNGAGAASPGTGGAIFSLGTLTMTSCTLSGNASTQGGAVQQRSGQLTMTDCVVSANSSTGNGGGVAVEEGSATLLRCLFQGNSAQRNAGGVRISVTGVGSASVTDCRFIANRAELSGGAITFNGAAGSSYSIIRTTLGENSAGVAGGALATFGGDVSVGSCTLAGNVGASGGAIYHQSAGTLSVTLSSVSGNVGVQPGGGAGIFAFRGTINVVFSTISRNRAVGAAGGGGILLQSPAVVVLTNSIVAQNTATVADGDDVLFSGGTLMAAEQNLIGNNESAESVFPAGALAGTPSVVLDARLAELGQNGGPTATHLPLDGSPALDAATGSSPGVVDQRGFPRVVAGASDLGAVERGPIVTVTSAADSGAGSLRAAVDAAASPDTRVRFGPGLDGQTVILTGGPLSIPANRNVDIDASSLTGGVILSGNSATRLFDVAGGAVLNLRQVALTAGRATEAGAGLRSFGFTTLAGCTVSGCTSTLEAGAIHAGGGTLALHATTLSGNAAPTGGALVLEGQTTEVSLTNSTVASNTGSDPGGVGGLLLRGGSLRSLHATIAFNAGGTGGGGIRLLAPATLRVERSIVAANTAAGGVAPDLLKVSGSVVPVSSNLLGTNTSVTSEFPEGPAVGTSANPRNPVLLALANYGGFARTLFPAPGSPALDAAGASPLLKDQRGFPRGVNGASDLGAVEVGAPDLSIAQFANVSTRLRAGSGDSIPIAGFAVRGGMKKVAIRVLGPTLSQFGVPGPLANPTLTLVRAGDNATLKTNDNWQDDPASAAELTSAGLGLPNALECGVVLTLGDGTYTAVVRGVSDAVGACLVEVYDLSRNSSARLVNLSTRGPVGTGDNVMIGGLVIGPGQSKRVLFRVLGPSLTQLGVPGALQDPTLEVLAGATSLALNDDWQSSQPSEITATGFAPFDAREPAVILTLGPGSYTAIVRGKNSTTGNAIVEAYELP